MHFVRAVDFTFHHWILHDYKEMMRKGQETPMMDVLDEYAVFTFVYHHLLPCHMPFLVDRDATKLPLTFISNLARENAWWIG